MPIVSFDLSEFFPHVFTDETGDSLQKLWTWEHRIVACGSLTKPWRFIKDEVRYKTNRSRVGGIYTIELEPACLLKLLGVGSVGTLRKSTYVRRLSL